MRRTILLVLALGVAAARQTAAAEPAADAAIRTTPIEELLEAPPVGPAAARPATIRGIVTLWLTADSWLVQDGDAAIWVGFAKAHDPPDRLELGTEVVVSGTLRQAGYKPKLCDATATVLGRPGLPAARPADLDRLFAGADSGLRVACEGVVQRVTPDGGQGLAGMFVLACGPRHLRVSVIGDPGPLTADGLLDARVRVTGIVATDRNPRGELQAPRLFLAGPHDIEVLEPPAPAGAAADVPLDRINQFQFAGRPTGRITTTGVVTHAAGDMVCIEEEGCGIRLIPTAGALPQRGDRVRASGFLDTSRQFAGLRDATVERIGGGACPPPATVAPAEIVRINERAWRSRERAVPRDYDGSLIAFPARLVEARPRDFGGELLLACDGISVTARLEGDEFGRLAALAPDSRLDVRGICELRVGSARQPFASPSQAPPVEVALLLRSPDDVTVVAAPSWWTPRRLAAVLAATVAALSAVLGWAWLLRRQVATQAGLLAREMRLRRDAAIEYEAGLRERNRLAANLHDTLLQTLVGVDYQLGACGIHGVEAAPASSEHLGIARGMLAHATQELRQSVWALRTVPLDGRPFVEAVQGVVVQIAQGHPERIDVRAEGEPLPLPKFVAGNLLLVAQEAVHNVLQHAEAGRIDVAVRFDAARKRVAVEVRDDGRGFDVAGRPGPAEGHFGLAGMQERAERLGGELAIESRPGAGTTVRAVVPLKPFDADLE
ncbi:MAG: sensor histidine kinase [Planctomycetaceae bacterium]